MPQTSHRTSLFPESVIRRMTRVANAHGAINLSQGFPDFDPPPALLAAAERAGRHGPHQYAVTCGAPNFRAALARKQSRFTGLPIDPDANTVVTCGSTEASMDTSCTRPVSMSIFRHCPACSSGRFRAVRSPSPTLKLRSRLARRKL